MEDLSEVSAFQMDDISSMTYLRDVTQILAEYSWIYNVRNTEIFIHNVLENIPLSWCEVLTAISDEDLCQLPFDFIQSDWPPSLVSFLIQCQQLANFRFPPKTAHDIAINQRRSNYMPVKVASKKQFEIEIMADLIGKICQEHNCHLVLDIGSGLGYLDQLLHHRFSLGCIGIDSSLKYTNAANDRIKNDSCMNSMHHITFEVTHSEKCIEELKSILNEKTDWNCGCVSANKLSSDSLVMVGLHSCGNLTQDMMKLFCQMDEVKAFVCVGCCYNKINLNDFPMSSIAQRAVYNTHTNYPEWHPCVSGLRLAAHGTRTHSVKSLVNSHILKSMFYRALMEYYIQKENISWHQPKRHIRSSDLCNFETYCKNMLQKHPFCEDETTLQNLINLYKQKEYLLPRVKILLVLQMMLQPLWESFVIVDRMLYFREKYMSVKVLALWDDAKSSRNLALCVNKR
ncbi:protein RRNAD1 [Trichonephila inaurata madagascariensis]|uniref:Protein RRNAD1 n=1 Tax=Trichonephila inaurata madagascariensis TaxID=2747483 RepID=A0A8X7CE33_9ARAC|nr:protein RRNAD1 [Trichonephila inaurata madagascariensis]